MASAERYEVLIDFSKYKPGQRIELRNLSNEEQQGLRQHEQDHGLRCRRDRPSESEMKLDPKWNYIPTTLADSHVMRLTRNDAEKKRQFRVQRGDPDGPWNVSGMTWEDVIASNFKLAGADPKLNGIGNLGNREQVRRLVPSHPHPPRSISRSSVATASLPRPWERGPKDVMYVGENEKIQVHHASSGRTRAVTWCTATTSSTRTTP